VTGPQVYEVHECVKGRWSLDSVTHSKDVAIARARSRLEALRAVYAVKVLSVRHTIQGKFSEVTVYEATLDNYRFSASQAQREAVIERQRAGRAVRRLNERLPRPARPQRDFKSFVAMTKHAVYNPKRATLILLCALLVWCAIFYVARQPQTPWVFDSPAAQLPPQVRHSLPLR